MPTYSVYEVIELINDLDKEGVEHLLWVVHEEHHSYSDIDYKAVQSTIVNRLSDIKIEEKK